MAEHELLQQSIDEYIDILSEKHRLHRKIRFLLDIRGLLVINKLKGDYVEFGVYRGEMMYAAARILGQHIDTFIGLDTFQGLPEPQEEDEAIFVFEKPGFMAAPKESAATLMKDYNTVLIEGDFRKKELLDTFKAEVSQISVLVVDANWPSSVEAALTASYSYLQSGSILFMDDYFVGTQHANFNDSIIENISKASGLIFSEFMTYPPCARAFLVENAI